MSEREELERLEQQVAAEIRALLATPGAFEQWVKLACGVDTMVQIASYREDPEAFEAAHESVQRRIAYADAYAAEIRERFEAALFAAAESALTEITGDAEAVARALEEHEHEITERYRCAG